MDLKITPSGQTIVKATALGPVANTDTKLLIYGLFQKGRVLAQDGEGDATLCVHPGILGIEHCRVGSHGHGEALVHVQHLQPGAGGAAAVCCW